MAGSCTERCGSFASNGNPVSVSVPSTTHELDPNDWFVCISLVTYFMKKDCVIC